MNLNVGDTVELKKAHPCGSRQWKIIRTGMDIKLCCLGCNREIMAERHKIEKQIKKITPAGCAEEL